MLYALLDDYAGTDGRAFPKRALLATSLDCSVSAVAKALAELEAWGWVHREQRFREDGSQTSTLYTLGAGRPTPVDVMTPPRVHLSTPPVSTTTHQEGEPLEGDPGKNTPPTPRKRGEPRDLPDDDPRWLGFWSAYPRKVGKGAARKAYAKALRKTTAETLQGGAERVAREHADRKRRPRPEDRGTDPLTFVPHPATWLNRESWADELDASAAPVDGASARPQNRRKGLPECPHHPGNHLEGCRVCITDRLAGDR